MLARMASEATWAKRVAEWRESGLTSEEFCRGKAVTAGGLRCAATTTKKGEGAGRAPVVAVAKVVRTSSTTSAAVRSAVAHPAATGARSPDSEVAVVLEVGGVRLGVRRGCDATTLTAVFEALFQRGGAR